MSFLTCFCDLPQKEHLRRSPPSPIRATNGLPCTPGQVIADLTSACHALAAFSAVNSLSGRQPAPPGSFSDPRPLSRRYLVAVGSPTPLRVVSSFPCTGFVGQRPDIL